MQNNRPIILLALVSFFVAVGCKKKGAALKITESPQPGYGAPGDTLMASHPVQPSSAADHIQPDEKSFFPLIAGSYWVYEDFLSGTKQDHSRQFDSVASITRTDSGYVAVVKEKDADGSTVDVTYRVDSIGQVWAKRSSGGRFSVFTSLNPRPGQKIGSLIAYAQSGPGNSDSDRVLLQPYPYESDSLSAEQRLEWSGLTFQRGIGMVAHSGEELSSELMEYRIGLTGPIWKMDHSE